MFGKNGFDPAIKTLDKIYQLFNKGQKKLEKNIGVPVCISNCGKCCEVNCLLAKGVEARYIALWVQKQPLEFQEKIATVCEEWLLRKNENEKNEKGEIESRRPGVFYGLGTMGMPREMIDQTVMEAAYMMQKWACPLLTEDKKCLIHPARPMTCRAFGITRIVGADVCPRPGGKVEEKGFRAFLQHEEITEEIKENIELLKKQIPESNYMATAGFLAAMLYMELKPQKYVEHAYHNEIPSAKMVQFGGGMVLWQDQLQEIIDREAEIKMIVNPGISTVTDAEKAITREVK